MGREACLDDAGQGAAHLRNGLPCGTKVEEDGCAVGAHDDVVGGYVTVKEIGAMHDLECVEQRRNDPVQFPLRWQSP